jgi:hypothetical protein
MTDPVHPQSPSTKAHEPEHRRHAYDDPDLGPIQFLEAVMHEDTLSIALRMKAAKHLALIAAKAPQSSVTIRIPDPVSDEYIRRFPWLTH